MHKFPAWLVVAIAAVTAFGVGGMAAHFDRCAVMSVDGQLRQVNFFGTNVKDALRAEGIELTEHDIVSPSLESRVNDSDFIAVKFARPVTITVDGKKTTFWTTATTVDDALKQIGLFDPAARLSVDRSLPLGREGITLTATNPHRVQLSVDGSSREVISSAASVGALLNELGIKINPTDKVEPTQSTPLSADLAITVTRITYKTADFVEDIPFETKTTPDSTLPEGVTKVQVAGVNGTKEVRATLTYTDGVESGRSVLRETVTKNPVTEEKLVGTMVIAGMAGHTERMQWMSDAGISPSDFEAANILIFRESGWNPTSVNASSGACGLVQALPCSKIGDNWSDPVTALKWGNNYVLNRYGGWRQALDHSYQFNWY